MQVRSEEISVRMRAKLACFTRPEFRAERASNVVASLSGWEGVLRQVMGHRGARYEVTRTALLFHPRWLAVTTNEVKDFGNGRTAINTEDRRTLRTTSFLAGNRRQVEGRQVAGVDFLVTFRLAAEEADIDKFHQMLTRRLENGHFWRQPYLGIRECPALVEPVSNFHGLSYPEGMDLIDHPDGTRTADVNMSLGICFFGVDWEDPKHPGYYAPLEVKRGIVNYPTWAEVRRLGIKRDAPAAAA